MHTKVQVHALARLPPCRQLKNQQGQGQADPCVYTPPPSYQAEPATRVGAGGQHKTGKGKLATQMLEGLMSFCYPYNPALPIPFQVQQKLAAVQEYGMQQSMQPTPTGVLLPTSTSSSAACSPSAPLRVSYGVEPQLLLRMQPLAVSQELCRDHLRSRSGR